MFWDVTKNKQKKTQKNPTNKTTQTATKNKQKSFIFCPFTKSFTDDVMSWQFISNFVQSKSVLQSTKTSCLKSGTQLLYCYIRHTWMYLLHNELYIKLSLVFYWHIVIYDMRVNGKVRALCCCGQATSCKYKFSSNMNTWCRENRLALSSSLSG